MAERIVVVLDRERMTADVGSETYRLVQVAPGYVAVYVHVGTVTTTGPCVRDRRLVRDGRRAGRRMSDGDAVLAIQAAWEAGDAALAASEGATDGDD